MALVATDFQNYLAGWEDQMASLLQELETWAGNKADNNSAFDFTAAKNSLETAKSNLISTVTSVSAT